jgi:hypothetical protein
MTTPTALLCVPARDIKNTRTPWDCVRVVVLSLLIAVDLALVCWP